MSEAGDKYNRGLASGDKFVLLSKMRNPSKIAAQNSAVIAGLDPAIHLLAKRMDARVIGEPSDAVLDGYARA